MAMLKILKLTFVILTIHHSDSNKKKFDQHIYCIICTNQLNLMIIMFVILSTLY